MSRLFTLGLTTLMAASLAGCATTGGPEEQPLKVVQAIQVGDDALDCASLQGQIFQAESVVSKLTQEIESSQTMARANDTAAAIGNYLGQSTFLNSLMASSARDTVQDTREVRDSYQRRRDILLQQYMHKKCSVQSQAAPVGS